MQRDWKRECKWPHDTYTHLISGENSTSIYGDVKKAQKTACLLLI